MHSIPLLLLFFFHWTIPLNLGFLSIIVATSYRQPEQLRAVISSASTASQCPDFCFDGYCQTPPTHPARFRLPYPHTLSPIPDSDLPLSCHHCAHKCNTSSQIPFVIFRYSITAAVLLQAMGQSLSKKSTSLRLGSDWTCRFPMLPRFSATRLTRMQRLFATASTVSLFRKC